MITVASSLTPEESARIELRRRLKKFLDSKGPCTPEDIARIELLIGESPRPVSPQECQEFEKTLGHLRAQATRDSLKWHESWLEEIRTCQSVPPNDPDRRRRSLSNCRYVYLMRADNGEYKIGESRHPRKRRRQVQRKEGRKVDLITQYPTVVAPRLERMLHRHFRHVHVRDERFNLSENVTLEFWETTSLLDERVLELEAFRLREVIRHLEERQKGTS